MPDDRSVKLTRRFDAAFRELTKARAEYEDHPRDPQRIAALGTLRIRLDDARAAMVDERRRLGLDAPQRLVPAPVDRPQPPPLWAVDFGANA